MFLVGVSCASASIVVAAPAGQQMVAEGDRTEAVPSRAAQRRLARQERARQLHSRRLSGFEKVMAFAENGSLIKRVFGASRGFHPIAGDFPGSSGFGFGIGFTDEAVGTMYPRDDLANRVNVRLRAAKSTRNYTDLRAELGFLNLGGSRFGFRLRGRYWEWKQMPFFGRGPDSSKADRSSFRWDSSELGGEAVWRPGSWEVAAGAALLRPEISSGESGEFPSAEEIFDPEEIPGAQEQPDFMRYDVTVSLDHRPPGRRDWTAFAGGGGGYYSLRYSFYDDRNLSRFNFHRFEVEIQEYFAVKWRRAIVLRGNAVFVRTNGRNEVPFYYQPTLGGKSMLRSFLEFRFYDDNRVLLTTEYRWAAWSALNMALFVDLGKVYPESEKFSIDGLRASYGLGFRFKSAFGFMGRVDLAHGSEGFRAVAAWRDVF